MRASLLWLLAMILAAGCSTPTTREPNPWRLGDMRALQTYWQQARRLETASEQRDRGLALYYGLGLPIDFQEGLNLLSEAARKGDRYSALIVRAHFAAPGAGLPTSQQKQAMLRAVEGPILSPSNSERWLEVDAAGVRPKKDAITAANDAAAQRGNSVAMYNLAVESSLGRLSPLNRTQAVHWLKQAAAAELPEAQGLLGLELMQGKIVPKDVPRGYQLVTQAADADVRFALEFLVQLEEIPGLPRLTKSEKVRYLGRLAQKDEAYLEAWYHAARAEPADPEAAQAALKQGLARRMPFALEEQARSPQR